MIGVFIYAIGWLSFAIVHSLLARQWVQQKIEPHLKGSYRLLYNGFSVIHLAVVFLIGKTYIESQRIDLLSSSLATSILLATKLLGLAIIVLSLTKYDLGRFSGLTQIRTQEYLSAGSAEPLQVSGLNNWVRHPLYSGAFLYLWGGAGSLFGLWTAIFGSFYLLIGTYLEERKLLSYYGTAYKTYQAEVPKYFPFRRSLSSST